MVRAAYLPMQLTTQFVIVPLALASLLTGLVQSLGTTWGLFRHYWVLVKFLLTILATIVLLLYTQSASYFAGVVAGTTLSSAVLGKLRNPTHVLHAGAALLVLLVTTTLSPYKPPGMTLYGWRTQHEQRSVVTAAGPLRVESASFKPGEPLLAKGRGIKMLGVSKAHSFVLTREGYRELLKKFS